MDELPNHVLLKLLHFIEKNAPNIVKREHASGNSHISAANPKSNMPIGNFKQKAQVKIRDNNVVRFAPYVDAKESSQDDSGDTYEESEEE